jgi:Ca2+-binding RTX toxin-like protein
MSAIIPSIQIFVKSTSLGMTITGNGAHLGDLVGVHTLLVYTDNEGNQFAVRGGPKDGEFPVGSQLTVKAGSYDASFKSDFPQNGGDGNTIGQDGLLAKITVAEGWDLAAKWDSIVATETALGNAGYNYGGVNVNCNTVTNTALENAGLPTLANIATTPLFPVGLHAAGGDQILPLPVSGDIVALTTDQQAAIDEAIQANDALSRVLVATYGSALVKAESIQYQNDPLLLDLNGDGIKTTTLANGIFFNHDANDFSELSAWVDKNDGVLVADLNHNGVIDNGTEVFGNHTLLPNNTVASDGYAALAQYDSNSDGVIDSLDQNFAQLGVLKGDGTLLTLQQAGIQSFDLSQIVSQVQVDENGNTETKHSLFTKTDNSTGQMGDFNLLANTAVSNPNSTVEISEEIAALPNASGSGNVYSLQQAMALDSSGTLQGFVESFIGATDEASRNTLLDQILAQWAGVPLTSDLQPGDMLLATHVAVVEQFEGHNFNNGDLSFIGTIPAGMIAREYNQLAETLYGQLMAQSQLQDYFAEMTSGQDATTHQFTFNLDGVEAKIQTLYATDETAAIQVAAEFSRALTGINWAEISNYANFYNALIDLDPDFKAALDSTGKAFISGTSAAELLGSDGQGAWDTGTDQSSRDTRPYYIDAGAGNDTLQGSYSDDVLIGGQGNDTLRGYDGNDSYLFNLGDGQDTIIEGNAYTDNFVSFHSSTDDRISTGNDSILFGAGIAPTDLSYSMDGDYLKVNINGTTDQISILSKSMDYLVEQLVFQDGTVVKTTDIFHTFLLEGTSGNDTLAAQGMFYDVGQHILGYGGDDQITGSRGDDTLDGGDGNDYLYSGQGNDTLIGGNGNDNLDDEVGGSNLLDGGAGNDGLVGGQDQDTLLGGAGTDTLLGLAGNDSLDGGAGNDLLQGGDGNDTYVIHLNEGQDTITDGSGTDTLSFGTGLTEDQMLWSSNSNHDLIINFGNSTNQLLIQDQLNPSTPNQVIDSFQFADGSVYTSAQIASLMSYDSIIAGTSGNDTLVSATSDDALVGKGGDDTYVFSDNSGKDKILDASGNNTLDFHTLSQAITADLSQSSLHFTSADTNQALLSLGTVGTNAISDPYGHSWTAYDNAVIGSSNSWKSGEKYLSFDGSDDHVGTSAISPTGDYWTAHWKASFNTLSPSQAMVAGNGYSYAVGMSNGKAFMDLSNNNSNWNVSSGDQFGSKNNYVTGQWYDFELSYSKDSGYKLYVDGALDISVSNTAKVQTGGQLNFGALSYGGSYLMPLNGSLSDIYFTNSQVLHSGSFTPSPDPASIAYAAQNTVDWSGSTMENVIGTSYDDGLSGNSLANQLTGSAGNDTLSGAAGNDTLFGGSGNDVYHFSLGGGSDSVSDSAGTDTFLFDSSVVKNDIALFQTAGGNLEIGYTNSAGDLITVQGQNTAGTAIERFELSDGSYLTDADVNSVIQAMASYATTSSASFTSLSDVENNSNLLTIVNSGWHH